MCASSKINNYFRKSLKTTEASSQKYIILTQDTASLQKNKMPANMLAIKNVAQPQNAMTKDALADIPKTM